MAGSGSFRYPDPQDDQQRALHDAAGRLREEYRGVFARETVERFLRATYDELATGTAVRGLLPRRVEHLARQRMQALARAEGRVRHGKTIVLFLCVHNAGRSQMAAGLFARLAADRAVAWSAGSDPAAEINPAAVTVMRERGIDITREFPKRWTDEVILAADVVVTMGCGDACPVYPGKRYLDWPLDDPHGRGPDEVRPICDEIERRVRGLIHELEEGGELGEPGERAEPGAPSRPEPDEP